MAYCRILGFHFIQFSGISKCQASNGIVDYKSSVGNSDCEIVSDLMGYDKSTRNLEEGVDYNDRKEKLESGGTQSKCGQFQFSLLIMGLPERIYGINQVS